jgi:hypothetical protein
MKKGNFLVVGLIGLLLATGLVLVGCQQDVCRGSCNWNVEYGLYGGCDSVSGGRCYDECAAYKAFIEKRSRTVRCDC